MDDDAPPPDTTPAGRRFEIHVMLVADGHSELALRTGGELECECSGCLDAALSALAAGISAALTSEFGLEALKTALAEIEAKLAGATSPRGALA